MIAVCHLAVERGWRPRTGKGRATLRVGLLKQPGNGSGGTAVAAVYLEGQGP